MVKPKTLRNTIIVAGHPRSGTSLVCQLLESAGVKFLSDIESDEYNREGYYEFSAALELEKSLLREAMSIKNTIKMNMIIDRINKIEGMRGLKIVRVPALFFYNHVSEDLKVVLVFRNPAEVKASMLRRGISSFSLNWAENNNALIAAYENIPNSILISYDSIIKKDKGVFEKFKKLGLSVDERVIKQKHQTQKRSKVVLSDFEEKVYAKLLKLEEESL